MSLDDGVVVTLAVGQRDDRLSLIQTTPHGLRIDAPTKEGARFNGTDVGGRFRIALWIALLVQAHLSEHAAELGFARARRTVGLFAWPPNQFAFAHRDAGPIETDIKFGAGCQLRRGGGARQPDLLLLLAEPLFDLAGHLFGDPLNLPRLNFQAGVAMQILGGLLELGLAARPGHQPAHPGRVGGVDDIQPFIVWKACLMAGFALIEGAPEGHPTQRGKKSFAAPAWTAHP